MHFKNIVLVSFLVFPFCDIFAQTPPDELNKIQDELVSSWYVVVDNNESFFERTLKIKGVTSTTQNEINLDVDYGLVGGVSEHPKTELIINQKQPLKIIFTTKPGSKINATQTASNIFQGTFTDSKGKVMNLKMTKIADSELKVKEDSYLGERSSFDENTPKSCADFFGGWEGSWQNVGQVWLWVIDVDAKCKVKYYYGRDAKNPRTLSFKIAEIKNGTLVIPRPSGTTSFEIQKNELVGRYSGSDGTNSGTLQKINIGDGSLEKKRTEQLAAESSTPINPSADVPSDCAAFFGTWSGSWSQGNFGEQWLRVISVSNKCVAKYSYLPSNNIPRFFETAEIKKGVLSFICNKSTGGTCNFERQGEKIWGNYSNSGGGSNSVVFQKRE